MPRSFAERDRIEGRSEFTQVHRVVALGASNLTRGFYTIVRAARENWGPDVEILGALGHGRSYGVASRFAVRVLPGILSCGLWPHLKSSPAALTRVLITDVGNDLLYGFSVEQTLAWVNEAVRRLQDISTDITLTDLPLASIRRLSTTRFLFFRSILVPSCRLSLIELLHRAEQLNEGLNDLAITRGIKLFRLDPSWYGVDPIHIRPMFWSAAWQRILGLEPRAERMGANYSESSSRFRLEPLRLYFQQPERQWLFGRERIVPQSGKILTGGGIVRLY